MQAREFKELQAFTAVAEQGSFTRAATRLQIAPSTLSQIVRELEERLGVLLIQRTTRRLSLTGAGLQLLTRLQPALEEISQAVEDAQQQSTTPRGTVRMHIPRAAYGAFLEPALARLRQRYPDILLDITVGDELVNSVASGFDLSVRLAELADPSYVNVDLGGPIRHVAVASRSYLNAHGAPNHPEDLAKHNCIQWRRPGTEASSSWRFNLNQHWVNHLVSGALTVSHCDVAVDAARQGLGIAFVLQSWANADIRARRLVSLLEQYLPPFPGWQISYPSRTPVTSALLAVIETLCESEI